MSFISNELRNYYKSLGFRVLRPGENAKDGDKLVYKGLGIPNYGIISIGHADCYQPVEPIHKCYVLRAVKPVKPAKSRKRLAYKVVKRGTLESARAFGDYGMTVVTYKVNEVTHAPKGTRIFTFEDLSAAKDFARIGEEIYECEVTDGIVGYGSYAASKQMDFWEKFNKFNKSRHPKTAIQKVNQIISKTQYRALLVTKVKLLRKVQ